MRKTILVCTDGISGTLSMEWAGTPHKGKTSPREAQLVRENLETINERLIAQGYRPVDPNNPEHARRYGFSEAAGVEAGEENV